MMPAVPGESCQRYRAHAGSLRDPRTARREDDPHGAGCAACQRWLADLESLLGSLAAVGTPDPPLGFAARLEQRLLEATADPARGATAPGWTGWLRPGPLALGAVGLAAALLLTLSQSGTPLALLGPSEPAELLLAVELPSDLGHPTEVRLQLPPQVVLAGEPGLDPVHPWDWPAEELEALTVQAKRPGVGTIRVQALSGDTPIGTAEVPIRVSPDLEISHGPMSGHPQEDDVKRHLGTLSVVVLLAAPGAALAEGGMSDGGMTHEETEEHVHSESCEHAHVTEAPETDGASHGAMLTTTEEEGEDHHPMHDHAATSDGEDMHEGHGMDSSETTEDSPSSNTGHEMCMEPEDMEDHDRGDMDRLHDDHVTGHHGEAAVEDHHADHHGDGHDGMMVEGDGAMEGECGTMGMGSESGSMHDETSHGMGGGMMGGDETDEERGHGGGNMGG